MLKIKEIEIGSIVWKKSTILGIKGATLDERYFNYDCIQVGNSPYDYEIIYKGTLKQLKADLVEKIEE